MHRDIGFSLIGLTLIYGLSGILLICRETGLLKTEQTVSKTLESGLTADELGNTLHMRKFHVIRDDEVIQFDSGTYEKSTGIVNYTITQYPAIVDKLIQLHKQNDKNLVHWFSMIYGILLLFLALSSLWMFKPNTKHFKRGMFLTSFGIAASVLILVL